MSNLFMYNGHLLLFIFTLQLHFITPDPLISNEFIGLILLLLVIGALIYLAYRNKSQILTGIVMIMIAFVMFPIVLDGAASVLAANTTNMTGLDDVVAISPVVIFLMLLLGGGWLSWKG